MIFKQGILKEEKIKLVIVIICGLIPYIAIAFYSIMAKDDISRLLIFFLIILIPIFLLILLLGLKNLEWFYIYNDRIEVRNIFGIKNSVFYDKVISVEELEINLTSRGMKKTFYIFSDGRKNNNNVFDVNSCYNNKKFNLRIYKTTQLENYILNSLKLKVSRK